MISYKVKPEEHPLYGYIELETDENGLVDILTCEEAKGVNILEESATGEIKRFTIKNNPNGYYHPREIVHLFTDDELKLSKLFTMKEWLEYYTDVCNNNIFPIQWVEDERYKIVNELSKNNDTISKEHMMMFGYNPELPFNLDSQIKQSSRLNNLINQKDEYEFIDEASDAEWSLTLRNFHLMLANFMKSASQTGNFKGLRKNLLKMVKSCKSKEELEFLRKDRTKAKPYLNKLMENKPKFKEQVEDHINWLDTEYKEALDNKAKELKSIKESYIEESVKGKTPIYIVLSRTYSPMSNVINKVTGDEYTHSGISFDLKLDRMYTFNKHGFYIDTLKEFKTFGNIPLAIYGVYIEDSLALKIKMKLNEFLSRKDKFHYSQLGLLGVVMNKPIIFDNRRFCSEFVDELLKIGDIDVTGKASALVRPQEFKNTNVMFKVFEGKINEYIQNKAERIVRSIKEEYIEESVLFSKEDLYINFDKWERKKDCNILYITGLSGSGKTTLTNELCDKYNAIWVEMDLIENNHFFKTMTNFNDGDKILKQYFDKYGYTDSSKMLDKELTVQFRNVYNWLLTYAKNNPNKLLILEGIQVYTQLHARDDLAGKPIIVKGSSVNKSFNQRVIKRSYKNSFVDFIKDLSINNTIDYVDMYKWLKKHDGYLTQFKDRLAMNEATLPVEFDKDGNLIVKNISKLDYQKEWEKSHKLLLGYENSNNIEGMKYEVAKLWYLNSKLEGLMYNKNTEPEDKKKYTDIRARILNDFNKYFKIITKDKTFNFTNYYQDTPFSTDSLKISKSTIFHTINIAKQIIRP